MVRSVLVGGIIPAEVVVSAGEIDVFFVKNSSPLERRLKTLLVFTTLGLGIQLTPCSLWQVVQ
jgi:hypothetical protein